MRHGETVVGSRIHKIRAFGRQARTLCMAVGLVIVFQLHRLFGSLAGGAIYTRGNVQRVRYVGLLLLLSAGLNAALPALTLALALAATLTQGQVGVQITLDDMRQTIGSFAAGGLVLLASWIMDVGLYAKEHADELQRESDLMI
jgi:cytochrome c biogenesis protein CcdA